MSSNRQDPAPGPGIAIRSLGLGLPPGHRIETHSHPWPQLVHAGSGAMTIHAERGVWLVPAHRAAWIPGGVEHEIRTAGRVEMRTLYLRPDLPGARPDDGRVVRASPLLRELILEVCRRGTLRGEVPDEARLVGVVLDQLAASRVAPFSLPMPRDPRARRVAERVFAHPDERATLAELAQRGGASARTLERVFVEQVSMTFGHWRQQARLLHAISALSNGATVTEAGRAVGYSSTSAFVARFRRAFGVTPGKLAERP